jgi:class 3 adenylate cyclase/tetratricopeptide (TPR) repeat protein
VDCSSCGAANDAGRKFCGQCGARLAIACDACGAANSPGDRFCGECGSPIGSPAAARAADAASPAAGGAAAPGAAERRVVSVLFADLVGFTTISETKDAEDVRELLSTYFETSREVVERYGGVVEKFIGDAVMAVWGTPVVHEDDAERAVRAALDLVEAVGRMGADVGAPQLSARAGVLTGEAAVTIGAVGQGMVAGDLVNTASRLQSAAEPGTVLVGDATYQAASRAIAFAESTPFTPKGKSEEIRTWRALRVVAQARGVGRSEALEPPFVGRSEELRLIKELLQGAARERRARLVSVTGIAGIGKSRLSWEFLKYIDGVAASIYWHHGRSPAYGEGVTFWALGEMVRMRARIAETEDPVESRRKLSAAVAEHVEDPAERRWIEPRLAHLLGLEDQPPGEREELFAAWRSFFERISDKGPVVMVFEDLQWADQGLLDFVESILEWSREHPIFILALARPEFLDRHASWGSGQRNFTAIHLEPLANEAMTQLIEGFVRGLAGDDVERILTRAEGVPLYAVETVRMLADRGALVAGDDAFEVAGEIGGIDVPETLQALIAARLDVLPVADRTLLQDAAVIGKSFTLEGLSAVAGDADEQRLRELVRREFLVRDVDPRSPERGQYSFVQSLIREVAYATLSKHDRRAKHLATAHFFESLDDDELAGVVASHYMEAYQTSPEGPDSEAVAARARDWLSQAAERAMSLGSPAQAMTYYDSALSITPRGAERAALLKEAGEAAERLSHFERMADLLEEAIAIHEELGDAPALAIAVANLGRPLFMLDRQDESLRRMEAALRPLAETDTRARAELLVGLAMTCGGVGRFEESLRWAEHALPVAERLGDVDILTIALGARSFALFNSGRPREAVILARGRLDLLGETGGLLERGRALIQVGVYAMVDDPRAGQRAWMEAAEVARRLGSSDLELGAMSNLVEAAIDLGDFDQAASMLAELNDRAETDEAKAEVALNEAMLVAFRGDEALARRRLKDGQWAESTQYQDVRMWYMRSIATVELCAGDLEASWAAATVALEVSPSGINGPNSVAVAARAATWLGDADRLRSAIGKTEPFRGRWIETVRDTAEAGLTALEGRRQESADAYARAATAWRALDCPLDLGLCLLDRVIVLGKDDPERDAVAAEAREIFERIGTAPFLDRLNAQLLSPVES